MMKTFPHSSKVELETRGLFDAAYANLPPAVSDLVFTNIYCWQDIYPYRISSHGGFLLVHYGESAGTVFLPPLLLEGKIDDKDFAERFEIMAEQVSGICAKSGARAVFRFVPEIYLKRINKDKFSNDPERGSFDYVYKRENLAKLAGQKYSAKRNLIKQFQRNHDLIYEPLAPQNLRMVSELMKNSKDAADNKVVERMLEGFAPLGLSGGVITAGGKPVAATISTHVRNFMYRKGCYDMEVVHFEKADTAFKGAYQAINNSFCSSLGEQVDYVNREEDLGLEGLRKAKLSYYPDRMIEKYRLSLK